MERSLNDSNRWQPRAIWALSVLHGLHALPKRSLARQERLLSAVCREFDAAGELTILRALPGEADELLSRLASDAPPAPTAGDIDDPSATLRHTVDLGHNCRALFVLRSTGRPFDDDDARWLAIVHDACAFIYEPYLPHGRSLLRSLSPRERETLEHLLKGASEKEVASALRRSRHTVHSYVKGIYRHLGVSSRGELLAIFVDANGRRTRDSETAPSAAALTGLISASPDA